jgi:hypothetical protein
VSRGHQVIDSDKVSYEDFNLLFGENSEKAYEILFEAGLLKKVLDKLLDIVLDLNLSERKDVYTILNKCEIRDAYHIAFIDKIKKSIDQWFCQIEIDKALENFSKEVNFTNPQENCQTKIVEVFRKYSDNPFSLEWYHKKFCSNCS